MKKMLLCCLTLMIGLQNLSPIFALNKSESRGEAVLQYSLQADKFRVQKIAKVQKSEKVIVLKRDLDELRYQAKRNLSLLQRIRDLEKVYRDVEAIIKGVQRTVKIVKSILGITDDELQEDEPADEFEHLSGVIMKPGSVSFNAQTSSGQDFDDLGLDELEFDLFYNRTLFRIDHIEGDGVVGDDYRSFSLSTKDRGAKERISLPLSDVLVNETSFRVFLAPKKPKNIKVGDKSKLKVKYYKRVPKGEEAPISYTANSDNKVVVTVK